MLCRPITADQSNHTTRTNQPSRSGGKACEEAAARSVPLASTADAEPIEDVVVHPSSLDVVRLRLAWDIIHERTKEAIKCASSFSRNALL